MRLVSSIPNVNRGDWNSVLNFATAVQKNFNKLVSLKIGSSAIPEFPSLVIGGQTISSTTIANWNTAYSWGPHAGLYDPLGSGAGEVGEHENTYDHSKLHSPVTLGSATGLSLSGQELSLTSGYVIPTTTKESNWDTAYSWGDHAGLYDPIGTGSGAVEDHENTYDHSLLHNPVTLADPANGLTLNGQELSLPTTASPTFAGLTIGTAEVTSTSIGNWNTAYGWGNHAGLYDPAGTASSAVSTHESTYNHSLLHDPVTLNSMTGITLTGQQLSFTSGYSLPTTASQTNWDTAYSWGDHDGLYDTTGTAASAISTHETTYDHSLLHAQVTLGTANGLSLTGQELSLPVTATPTLAGLALSKDDAPLNQLVIENTSSSSSRYPGFAIYNFGGTTEGHPYCGLYNASGTKDSPGVLAASRGIGAFIFAAHNGTSFVETARIQAITESAWDTSNKDTRLSFFTATGSGSITERMRITSTGNVWINKTSGTEKLEVGGVIRADSGFNTNGTAGVSDASAGVPTAMTVSGGIITSITKKDWLDQSVKQAASPTFAALTLNGGPLTIVDSPYNPPMEISANTASRIRFTCYHDNYSYPPGLLFRRARGTSSNPSVVQKGDILFDLLAYGRKKTGWSSASVVKITGTAAENWSDSATGSQLCFELVENGGTSRLVKMFLTDDGRLGVMTGGYVNDGKDYIRAQLHAKQPVTTAGLPVLELDQLDVDEPFIKFLGTAASTDLTRSIVKASDVTTATLAGYVKVEVQDDGNQITDQDYFMPIYTLA